jgi:hypothetical protein
MRLVTSKVNACFSRAHNTLTFSKTRPLNSSSLQSPLAALTVCQLLLLLLLLLDSTLKKQKLIRAKMKCDGEGGEEQAHCVGRARARCAAALVRMSVLKCMLVTLRFLSCLSFININAV